MVVGVFLVRDPCVNSIVMLGVFDDY